MKEIELYIENYFGIGGKNLARVANMFKIKRLEKDGYLLKQDQYAVNISFVRSGFLRIYAQDMTGEKEITQWVSNQGMFITDLSSFVFDTTARWNIQALSDCELYSISKEDYRSLGSHIEGWDNIDKLFIAKCFITLENRVFGLLSMSAEQRVKELMNHNPSIFNQVPLHYIASMLGITPETLSRIRRKMVS